MAIPEDHVQVSFPHPRAGLLRLAARACLIVTGLFAASPAAAQGTDIDVIRGRIIASDSSPVANANVKVTSYTTQAVRQVRTDARGRFSIVFQNGGGDFIINVNAIGVAPVETRVRREGDEEVLLVNLVMHKLQLLEAMRITEAPRPKTETVPVEIGAAGGVPANTVVPPELQGDLNALAATLAGVALVLNPDGSVAGFSALGLDPSQNGFTLNGMTQSSTSLPRDAQVVTRVNTTSFDASRGKFSGAQVSSYAMSGGPIQQHTIRISFDDPSLQYEDRSATSLTQQTRNIQFSGLDAGEIVRDKSNYNVSWQAGRRTSPLNTILDADSSGLARLGLTADSVARFEEIIRALGVPFSAAGIPSDRSTENLSAFGRLDFNLGNGSALNTTFNTYYSKNDATSLSPRAFPSYGGHSESWGATLQGHLNSNVGGSFLNELQAQIDLNQNDGEPFLALPAGGVLVSTLSPDGGTSIQNLQFGSNSGLLNSNRNGDLALTNTLSWFNGNSRHRLKLGVEAEYQWYDQLQAGNDLGTFTFNSLDDLAAGSPASFTRRIGTNTRFGDAVTGGASLTDTWRKTNALQFQLGLRADGVFFPTIPKYNPEVDQLFGIRTDHAPNLVDVSPRFGFSWNVGKAPAGVGTMFGPSVLGTLSGGVGRFTQPPGANALVSAIDATGLPDGAQQLTCVGPAVPAINWQQYLANPGSIPAACADGTGAAPFTLTTPRVNAFDPSWQPPSAWRANVGWNGYLTSRFRVNVTAQYSLNQNISASVDRNFSPVSHFTLADEGGRPVFVDPSAIVASTGAVSLLGSRQSADFSQVMVNRGDGESRSAQLTIGLSPVQRTFTINPTTWSISWTTVRVNDRVRGYGANTDGNPLDFQWGRASGDIAHQINANLRKGFGTSWSIVMSARAQSGQPFTPLVGGDVNGDGLNNDRAYVFNPAVTTDSAVAAGMRSLLAGAPASIRQCLTSQLGTVAGRNSCRGPWAVSNLNAQIVWTPRNLPNLGDRVRFTFTLTNWLAGVDALVHDGRMEGWGQPGFADPTLLYVTGFDPVAQRFVYQVNQRFGETRGPRSLPPAPFRVTLDMRIALGPSFERQQAAIELRSYRRPGQPPATVQSIKQRQMTNAVASLRQVVAQKDSLKLTKAQLDSVNKLVDVLSKKTDSLWTPTAEFMVKHAELGVDDETVAKLRETRSAVQEAQFTAYRALRGLLTVEQQRKLRPPISFMISEDYMRSVKLMNNAPFAM